MPKLKQQGFSIVLAVVILCGLAVVGFAGWRIWEANQPKPAVGENSTATQTQPDSKDEQTTDPNEGYMVIKEWGVRMPLNNAASGIYYKLDSSSIFATLSTPRLDELSGLYEDCASANESVSIRRVQPGDEFAGRPLTEEDLAPIATKVNNFYYQPHMQQPCFGNPDVLVEVDAIRAVLFDTIKKIEKVKE